MTRKRAEGVVVLNEDKDVNEQRPQMGQPVRAMRQAVKSQESFEYTENDLELSGVNTIWKPECNRVIDGLYIGYRIVSDGVSKPRTYLDPEYKQWYTAGQRVFNATCRREVWLVVPSDRENPVMVFPEDVIWE